MGPYPLIVVSHGGPPGATGYSFDFKKQFFAANGYFVLDTNFRSSTGYGDAFKWATWGEWGKKDGEDVVSGIDAVIKKYPVDPKRVGHTGHSYGGFMTNWLITQDPRRFSPAIPGAGITNWMRDYGTPDIYRPNENALFAASGVTWAYASTAGFGFRYDDYGVVRPWTATEVRRVLDHSWDPTGIEPNFYRPLAAWWYALRFSVFGLNATAQHLVSLTGLTVCALWAGLFVWRETNRAYATAIATLLYVIYPAFVYSPAIWLTNP